MEGRTEVKGGEHFPIVGDTPHPLPTFPTHGKIDNAIVVSVRIMVMGCAGKKCM